MAADRYSPAQVARIPQHNIPSASTRQGESWEQVEDAKDLALYLDNLTLFIVHKSAEKRKRGKMQKRMSYSLYKKSYSEFPSADYDKASKTVMVDLPDYKKPQFPKEWKKVGNYYIVNNKTRVICWNTGYSENFVVECTSGATNKDKTFPAGLYVREKVIDYVSKL